MDNRLLQAAQSQPQDSVRNRLLEEIWPEKYTPPATHMADGTPLNLVGESEANYAWLRNMLQGDVDPATRQRLNEAAGYVGAVAGGAGSMIAGDALKNNRLQYSWNPWARAIGLGGRGLGHALQWVGTPAAVVGGTMAPHWDELMADLENTKQRMAAKKMADTENEIGGY